MSETVIVAIIVSLASPVLLEVFRSVVTKKNKAEEETRKELAILKAQVTDLQAANTKQLIEIGILQERNRTQENEIKELRAQVMERDERIHELELQMTKRGNKR